MDIELVKQMSPEEKNRKIMEILGIALCEKGCWAPLEMGGMWRITECCHSREGKPCTPYILAYCESLDACHEMEKVMTDEQHRLYRKLLFVSHYNLGEGQTNGTAERSMVSASAERRSDCFLAVMLL
jgi:hypothetical protein